MVARPSGRREKGIYARLARSKRLKRRYPDGLKAVLPSNSLRFEGIPKIRDDSCREHVWYLLLPTLCRYAARGTMRSLFQAAKAFVKRQKKTRCSFAPGRFPVYNLMKSFRICGSIITAFSYIAAAFFY